MLNKNQFEEALKNPFGFMLYGINQSLKLASALSLPKLAYGVMLSLSGLFTIHSWFDEGSENSKTKKPEAHDSDAANDQEEKQSMADEKAADDQAPSFGIPTVDLGTVLTSTSRLFGAFQEASTGFSGAAQSFSKKADEVGSNFKHAGDSVIGAINSLYSAGMFAYNAVTGLTTKLKSAVSAEYDNVQQSFKN